jgi:hypothetical protein
MKNITKLVRNCLALLGRADEVCAVAYPGVAATNQIQHLSTCRQFGLDRESYPDRGSSPEDRHKHFVIDGEAGWSFDPASGIRAPSQR